MFETIVCILFPRFELVVAAGRERLTQGPLALAPQPGRQQVVGEVSAAAEALGVTAGMRLGEALGRCPTLSLVMPDPLKVTRAWEWVLLRLEGIGAAVESGHPGVAWFDGAGLMKLYGGSVDGVINATRKTLLRPVRIGVAGSRFAASAAATRARPRKAVIFTGDSKRLARYLKPFPIDTLSLREETARLPLLFERFGIKTLGELAAFPSGALQERFGKAGQVAQDLARGLDTPLRPREGIETIEETFELPESACGEQLARALTLLIDRLLANPLRRARPLRAAVVSAELVGGGSWSQKVPFRQATSDSKRIGLTLIPKLNELPAPASSLTIRAEGFGQVSVDQEGLFDDSERKRKESLGEGIKQARTTAGSDAALRVIPIDTASRVPERHFAFAPWEA